MPLFFPLTLLNLAYTFGEFRSNNSQGIQFILTQQSSKRTLIVGWLDEIITMKYSKKNWKKVYSPNQEIVNNSAASLKKNI